MCSLIERIPKSVFSNSYADFSESWKSCCPIQLSIYADFLPMHRQSPMMEVHHHPWYAPVNSKIQKLSMLFSRLIFKERVKIKRKWERKYQKNPNGVNIKKVKTELKFRIVCYSTILSGTLSSIMILSYLSLIEV